MTYTLGDLGAMGAYWDNEYTENYWRSSLGPEPEPEMSWREIRQVEKLAEFYHDYMYWVVEYDVCGNFYLYCTDDPGLYYDNDYTEWFYDDPQATNADWIQLAKDLEKAEWYEITITADQMNENIQRQWDEEKPVIYETKKDKEINPGPDASETAVSDELDDVLDYFRKLDPDEG